MRPIRNSSRTSGTSFHGTTVTATVRELEEVLGAPTFMSNDGQDKVNFEWEMETEAGEVFTVYDWKEYRPISKDETIEWHIGGMSAGVTSSAADEIKNALGTL